jgi:hypothetical protein
MQSVFGNKKPNLLIIDEIDGVSDSNKILIKKR